MSTGPSAMIVVGETDWWDTQYRGGTISVDSRMREVYNNTAGSPDYDTVCASKDFVLAALKRPVYAECIAVRENSNGRWHFGLIKSASVSLASTFTNGLLNAHCCAMRNSGDIYIAGIGAESGLATLSAGDVVGLRLWYDDSTSEGKFQFYLNGSTFGSTHTLPSTDSWRLAWAGGDSGEIARLCVDADELLYLPADCQPWGAAAVVAVRGTDGSAYSPAATAFSAVDPDYTLDAYSRTASGSSTASGIALCATARSRAESTAIIYTEFVLESDGGTVGLVGLEPRSRASTALMGGAGGYAYYLHTGQKRTGAVNSAYGSAAVLGDRIGVIWQQSTGKIYWSINGVVQNSGDPVAGTGWAFDTATGDLVPAVTPYQSRIRLCTHAREQLYRPSYAEAWDGADLLPEICGADRLAAAPSIKHSLAFLPDGARARSNSIGALDLSNADGLFDALVRWELRNAPVVAYQQSGAGMVRDWMAVVESLEYPDESTLRIALSDPSSVLDTRVDAPLVAFGKVSVAPVQQASASALIYDVCQTPLCHFQVRDGGAVVTDWQRSPAESWHGFKRTVAPTNKQCVTDLEIFRQGPQVSVANADFSGWTAGVPNSWTVTSTGAGATVTQSGAAARFQSNASNGVSLTQSPGLSYGKRYLIKVVVSAYTSGDLWVSRNESVSGAFNTAQRVGIGSTGTYWFRFATANDSGGPFQYLTIGALASTDLTVDSIDVYEAITTTDGLVMPLEDLGGMDASGYEIDMPSTGSVGRVSAGFVSDQRPLIRTMLGAVCDSWFADYYTDADEVLHIVGMIDPNALSEADPMYVGDVVETDVFGELAVKPDLAPALSSLASYAPNFAQHSDNDLIGSVAEADRYRLTRPYYEVSNTLTSTVYDAFYAHANGGPPMIRPAAASLVPEGALPVGDTQLPVLASIYQDKVNLWTFEISRDLASELGIALGRVLRLVHSRYGLDAGRKMQIVEIERTAGQPLIKLTARG